MERMEKIAFIGLGIMGSPMARRLLAAGYPLTVWNRTASRAEPLQAEGASVAASPAEAVREAGVVITMLADPAAVREVIGGIAVLWKHFHMIVGGGYGYYFIPGMNIANTSKTFVPDLSLAVVF